MQRYIIQDEIRRGNAVQYLQALNLSKPWSVEIKEFRKNRSNSQNSLYWKWLSEIEQETGNSRDDLHEIFKRMFLGTETKTLMGKNVEVTRSTTRLNTKEFTEYLNSIEHYMADMGITLSHPDDYRYAMGAQ